MLYELKFSSEDLNGITSAKLAARTVTVNVDGYEMRQQLPDGSWGEWHRACGNIEVPHNRPIELRAPANEQKANTEASANADEAGQP